MSKTEIKVRAASLATFAAALAGSVLLETSAGDWVATLPEWVQAPAQALILAGIAWLAGWKAKNRPANLAPSTISAVEVALAKRMPRR